ncbi:hypothetical protein [Priestia megaterium]|uniref:hypothetical protein n=1 Tax=Priestia megaterium TaxID=1404 RepID=UPI003CC5E4E6
MSAKNLKKAKKFTVKLDKKRPMVFNFNTFCILSDIEENAYLVLEKVGQMNPKALRSMFYACLTAGIQLDNEDAELDLTKSEVGELVGEFMFDLKREKEFEAVMEEFGKAIEDFFPEAPTSEQENSDEKGATQTEENGEEKNETAE